MRGVRKLLCAGESSRIDTGLQLTLDEIGVPDVDGETDQTDENDHADERQRKHLPDLIFDRPS